MELLFFHVEWSSYSHSQFVPVFFRRFFFLRSFLSFIFLGLCSDKNRSPRASLFLPQKRTAPPPRRR